MSQQAPAPEGVDPSGTTYTLPPAVPGVPPAPPSPQQQYPAPTGYTAPANPPRTFTEDEVERFRSQERQKLHDDMERLREENRKLAEAEAGRQAQADEQARQAADAARVAAEEDMSAKDLLAQRDREWQQRFDSLQQEREVERAMAEREREWQGLQRYKAEVLAANADQILPRFNNPDVVHGSSEAEINQAVQRLVELSAATMADLRQVDDEAGRTTPGVSVRAPAMGPESFMPGERTLSVDQIKGMSMEDWQKVRQQLPPGRADQGDRGMFR